MKIKLVTLVLTIASILSVIPYTVSAAVNDDTALPLWQNTGSVSCKIGFLSDGYGYAEACVMGHPNVTKIHGDIYVYRQSGTSWVYVGEEHKTVENCTLIISCKFSPIDGEYYRASYKFVVTKNGTNETITQTKYKIA